MNSFPAELDILVLGAGPAGVCCALRLLDMGHRVGLVEPETFPRSQIGESLSPGIRNIFDYLGAQHLLEHETYLHHIPASVIWEQREQVYKHPEKHSGGIIVDRGILDQQLVKLAVSRGLFLLQPAKAVNFRFADGIWQAHIKHEYRMVTVRAKVILDARGRKGTLLHQRFHTAPSSVAIWTHIPLQYMPCCTMVEAVREGWFWGSPVTGNRYRIMAFCDGSGIKKGITQRFRQLLNQSELVNKAEKYLTPDAIETCSTTSYLANQPWHNQFIKTGEAAFTIDPLSSSGAEKAMRFSLQTAVAINTLLKTGDEVIAKAFYEEKLIGSVVHHTYWTRGYYTSAWPAKEDNEFWDLRKSFMLEPPDITNRFLQNLRPHVNQLPSAVLPKPNLPVELILQKIGHYTIRLSKEIIYQTMYAVEHDLVQKIPAINHPSLSAPIGFIENLALHSLLPEINNKTIFEAVNSLTLMLTIEKAQKTIIFLWQQELIYLNTCQDESP